MGSLTGLPIRMLAEVPPANGGIDFSAISASMESAFQNIAVQCLDIAGMIAPIGLSIFAVVFLWTQGKKYFKNLT